MSSLLAYFPDASVAAFFHLVAIFIVALLANRLLRLITNLLIKPAGSEARAAKAREQQTRRVAVVLYSAVCGFQAVAWNLLTRAALRPHALTRNHQATLAMRANHKYSYYAFGLYTACAIAAFWLPRTVAVAITLIWIVWLIVGIRIKSD